MSGFRPLGSILDMIVADCALRMEMREGVLTDDEIEAVMAEVKRSSADSRRTQTPIPGELAA